MRRVCAPALIAAGLLGTLAGGLITGCAGPGGPGAADVTSGPFDPNARVTYATIYKKVDAGRLRQARGSGAKVDPAVLAPAVGKGMADLVAASIEGLMTSTDLGQTLATSKSAAVYAYVLRTEDDRDVTVLSEHASFAAGGCVKLFESPRRRDYPRIAGASRCNEAR